MCIDGQEDSFSLVTKRPKFKSASGQQRWYSKIPNLVRICKFFHFSLFSCLKKSVSTAFYFQILVLKALYAFFFDIKCTCFSCCKDLKPLSSTQLTTEGLIINWCKVNEMSTIYNTAEHRNMNTAWTSKKFINVFFSVYPVQHIMCRQWTKAYVCKINQSVNLLMYRCLLGCN